MAIPHQANTNTGLDGKFKINILKLNFIEDFVSPILNWRKGGIALKFFRHIVPIKKLSREVFTPDIH